MLLQIFLAAIAQPSSPAGTLPTYNGPLEVVRDDNCSSIGIPLLSHLMRQSDTAWVSIERIEVDTVEVGPCQFNGQLKCDLAEAKYVGRALIDGSRGWEPIFVEGLAGPDQSPDVPRWAMSMRSGGPFVALVRRDVLDEHRALRAYAICRY
jgi:hypothetical protein